MQHLHGSVEELVHEALGVSVSAVLFDEEHLSRVIGVLLSDGRKAAVKVRLWSDRLVACAAVQRSVRAKGFPCAQVIEGPLVSNRSVVTIEEYVEASAGRTPSFAPTAEASGRAFYRHLSVTPDASDLPGLEPPPQSDAPRIVVGHEDWEAQNVLWEDGRLAVVHDWDSVAALPEAALVGAAGGVFGLTGRRPGWPSLADSADFLESYLSCRRAGDGGSKLELREQWTADDTRLYWAGGLWVHLFNAQKAVVRGQFGPYADKMRERVGQRLPLATQ